MLFVLLYFCFVYPDGISSIDHIGLKSNELSQLKRGLHVDLSDAKLNELFKSNNLDVSNEILNLFVSANAPFVLSLTIHLSSCC